MEAADLTQTRTTSEENPESVREQSSDNEQVHKELQELSEEGDMKQEGEPVNSEVYRATSLAPRSRDNSVKAHPLTMDWAFGMNNTLPVFSLMDQDRLVILYACSHVAVIYDHTSNSQHLLQGHCSIISCLCVSDDRRWIVTADKSHESLLIVWDSYTGIPVRTMFDCHPEGGVAAVALSRDSKYIVTVGAGTVQRVCIWDWATETEGPECETIISPSLGFQNHIIFNPTDSFQLLSNSESHVVFYTWDKGTMQPSTSETSSRKFNKAVGSFSQSVFHFGGVQAVSVTLAGNLVLWDVIREEPDTQQSQSLKAIKLIPLQKDGITVITLCDSFIVTGDVRGHVKFYDENFKFVSCYSEFSLEPVASISISKEIISSGSGGCQEEFTPNDTFIFRRNTVLSTVNGAVFYVKAHDSNAQPLLKENNESLDAVACHPKYPLVATGSHSGILKVWDYERKVAVFSRNISTDKIQCMAYDPQGFYLAVGFTSGTVLVLDACTLQSEENHFQYRQHCITHLTFSHDSSYLAAADSGKAVLVFNLCKKGSPCEWKYLGKHCSHYKPIQDLLFGVCLDSTNPRLLSLGMDRRIVEYDLLNSRKDELLIISSQRVEQSAVPTCMIWCPPLTTEHFLLIASDHYKMKLLNVTTRMCRKTLRGPTYGSPVKKMLILPNSQYMAYITEDKVGLQIFPLDGNPHKSSAVICHSLGVSTLACSYDGRYIFTAGGSDRTVFCWEISLPALEASAALGGKDLCPFYTLLEGGRDGELFTAMKDFFYYCQLRNQGIDSMETREVSTLIPLFEVPSIIRALGFYPSEQELEEMQNEVKFSRYAETGKYVTEIELEDFIKLYVNHRPSSDISRQELNNVFQVLGTPDEHGRPLITREKLLELLQARGEHMTDEELSECFMTLLDFQMKGDGCSTMDMSRCRDSDFLLECVLPPVITMDLFATEVLGFPLSTKEFRSEQH